MKFDDQSIAALPQRYRANLINSLPGYKPAVLVGTADQARATNGAIISSAFHLGSQPPLIGMIIRPDSAEGPHHTLRNLLDTGCYTLNSVDEQLIPRAHQTSARFAREQSEFDHCGIDAQWRENFNAPFVQDAAIQIGCELRQHQYLDINRTHLIIGEIVTLEIEDRAIREDGSVDLVALGMACVTGLDSYHTVKEGVRLAYAKSNHAAQLA